ncbi:hypothetical protein Pcinc_011190 [Petrolisthes cinctipes]|uniref:Uncharacterized protein n=1 Tax=Petrolisthes cinctipes TaxID=88211 RepID=A0AAE1G1G8_PETCI|nr:hypothetical protein Pcinc_011190 [Petrolisthes cinctipes]
MEKGVGGVVRKGACQEGTEPYVREEWRGGAVAVVFSVRLFSSYSTRLPNSVREKTGTHATYIDLGVMWWEVRRQSVCDKTEERAAQGGIVEYWKM